MVFSTVFLCALVLVCTVFSKLTLVSLTDKLRSATHNETHLCDENCSPDPNHDAAVGLYWQLLLVMIIPNIISFLRSLLFGVLRKTKKNFPWPTYLAIFIVSY